jgi:hypothetical protein
MTASLCSRQSAWGLWRDHSEARASQS